MSFARAYAELARLNACFQRQVRKGPGHPDFAAAYKAAKVAYRAFWGMAGSDAFATRQAL